MFRIDELNLTLYRAGIDLEMFLKIDPSLHDSPNYSKLIEENITKIASFRSKKAKELQFVTPFLGTKGNREKREKICKKLIEKFWEKPELGRGSYATIKIYQRGVVYRVDQVLRVLPFGPPIQEKVKDGIIKDRVDKQEKYNSYTKPAVEAGMAPEIFNYEVCFPFFFVFMEQIHGSTIFSIVSSTKNINENHQKFSDLYKKVIRSVNNLYEVMKENDPKLYFHGDLNTGNVMITHKKMEGDFTLNDFDKNDDNQRVVFIDFSPEIELKNELEIFEERMELLWRLSLKEEEKK